MKQKSLIILFINLSFLLILISCPYSYSASPNPRHLPPPVAFVLNRFNQMMEAGRYKEAVDLLISFQSRGGPKPIDSNDQKGYHHPEIYFALGNGHLIQEQYQLAEMAYNRALEMDPEHTLSWLNLAKAFYEQDKYAEAARCYLRGYNSSNEKDPEHLYFSAVSYLMADKYEKAIEIFELLFQSHAEQTKPEWKENMVHALLCLDMPRRALPLIKDLVSVYDGEKKIRWQEILLYQYLELDMPKQALTYASRLTNEYPTTPRWWKALAHIHLSKEDYPEALIAMTIYGLLTPLNQQETELLADLNMKLGIPAKAIFFYEAALTHNQNERIIQNLVTAYQHIEKYDMALNRLEDLDSSKMTPDLAMLKGDLLYAMGRYKEAEESFRQTAMAVDDKAGRAWLMAGYAAWQSDNLAASKNAFKKATDFPKQKKSALEALEKLKNIDAR